MIPIGTAMAHLLNTLESDEASLSLTPLREPGVRTGAHTWYATAHLQAGPVTAMAQTADEAMAMLAREVMGRARTQVVLEPGLSVIEDDGAID